MQSAMQVRTIVAAFDGSDHAYKALDLAADLAEKYDAQLIVLTVLSDKPLSDEERHLAATEYHTDFLEKLDTSTLMDVRGDPRAVADLLVQQYGDAAHQMRKVVGENLMAKAHAKAMIRGVKSLETMIEEGDPATVILAAAKNANADMIVLGSRGLGTLQGLLMGSVSHKVSQMAECTCIAVK